MNLEIAGQQIGKNDIRKKKLSDKKTKRLVFISGESNPLMFLKEFESSTDVKTEKDKMYKLLDFVDECHRGEFTKLYFTRDWITIKSAFLKLYSLPFVENKKKELISDFEESESLRSFFERKLLSLSKFTTLPFINQVEMVINDLPVEVSAMFIVE
ncbi:hypothetical protein Bhyg_03551 [Pseudolycoriella hygida]|uniref:Uncharacterized protein n=1 Tax=Pseudolycoriella hygida TaxID=35572 RepID=A0A9Q0S8U5_9DIPT|nr:hypothetical protein Bhyg_03551 [Pseudolycoriella hygida]